MPLGCRLVRASSLNMPCCGKLLQFDSEEPHPTSTPTFEVSIATNPGVLSARLIPVIIVWHQGLYYDTTYSRGMLCPQRLSVLRPTHPQMIAQLQPMRKMFLVCSKDSELFIRKPHRRSIGIHGWVFPTPESELPCNASGSTPVAL